jgi:hypothetical protein
MGKFIAVPFCCPGNLFGARGTLVGLKETTKTQQAARAHHYNDTNKPVISRRRESGAQQY